MNIYIAPLAALVGFLMYWFGNPKVARLGEIALFCGLFVTLLTLSNSSVSFRWH